MASSILDVLREAAALRINHGSSGNGSIRVPGGMRITPSGRAYSGLDDEDLVFVDDRGGFTGRPSSEWHLHHAVYQARPDVQSILHLHSPAATALSTLRRDLPPFHYMVAIAGGDLVRCAPYALFGTPELAEVTVTALEQRYAVLLSNHGLLTCAHSPDRAFEIAVEIETLCDSYLRACAIGEPLLLDPDEMKAVHLRFVDYRS